MSGPNDSGATPTGDFLALPSLLGPQGPSVRFRLKLHFDTPRLEWRPMKVEPEPPHDQGFLTLDDPFAALDNYQRYLRTGGYQFDLAAARFDLIDKAFLEAPVDPPSLLPSFAQIKAWQDEAFFKRIGLVPPSFGPSAQPLLGTMTPLAPPSTPAPFFKLPDPVAMRGDPPALRPGAAGDVMKAFMALPEVKRNFDKLETYGGYQIDLLKRDWDKAPWRDRITALALFAPLPAAAIGGILGSDEARHFAFKNLKGVDIPLPFLPGVSARIDDYGKGDAYLLGAKPGDPQPFKFGLMLDVRKAFPEFAKKF